MEQLIGTIIRAFKRPFTSISRLSTFTKFTPPIRTFLKMDKTVTFREHPASVVVSPTLRQSFNELVICGICKNILDTPKMLSCQHTFCLACLTADRKGRPSSSPDYQCQTCQVIAPVIDFNDLPKNLHIDTLLLILDPRNGEQLSERPVSLLSSNDNVPLLINMVIIRRYRLWWTVPQ